MNPGPDPDLTIVLLGNSGVGKSSSGNTILGQAVFEFRRSFISVTKEISHPTTGSVFGIQVSVVDTPGIFGSEQQIKTLCQKLLNSSRPCLFLVVVKIDRFTIEQQNAVEAAIRVIGDQGFNNCYLLFTAGDELNNMQLDDFINEDPEGPLPPVVERFSGRHHVFNNKNGGPHQVKELLEKSGHLVARPRPKRKIVLFGLPGAGKSASGNTILGSDQFTSAGGFEPVTTETTSKSAKVEGHQVTVVDTPGFSDEVLKPKQLYLEIIKAIKECSPGPHAFIIVVRIGRITTAEIMLFEMIEKVFGKDALKHAIVLFTYGDQLEKLSIDRLIQDNKDLKNLVSMCDGRYCVFDNSQKTNRAQVQNLLDKIDQIVNNNGGENCTEKMFKNAQTGSTYHSRCPRIPTWEEIKEWFIDLLNKIHIIIKGFMENSSSSCKPVYLRMGLMPGN